MTEKYDPEQPKPKLPYEHNAEFKRIFELLPDFGFSEEASMYSNKLKALFEKKLGESFLLKGSQEYLRREFDGMIIQGIRKDEGIFPSEMEAYSRLFRWDIKGSGGPFNPDVAPVIDRDLYRHVARRVLMRKGFEERLELEKDDAFDDFLEVLDEQQQANGGKRESMSLEDLDALRERTAKAYNEEQRKLDRYKADEELIRVWRNEYINQYHDEP